MSGRTQLQSRMLDASRRAGGAHLTRQARAGFVRLFVSLLYSLGYSLISVDQISVRAIQAFIDARKKAGRKTRTIQNDLSILRAILRSAGRRQFAKDPVISNVRLGISGGSRRGTKQAPTQEAYKVLLGRAKDPGLRAILMLERTIGLRAAEAIRSIPSLARWQRTLQEGKSDLHIIFGTKNGKPRTTHVFDRKAALKAVECALDVLANRRYLAPKNDLKKAMKWYSNAMYRLGFRGHALRYRFAQDALDAYRAAGYSTKESLALVSIDLGHGDTRGRWVRLVYGRRPDVPPGADNPKFSRNQSESALI
jgi:hypothetical protein